MVVEDRCHSANPYFGLVAFAIFETVDQLQVIANELIAVVGPVARVGVVQSQTKSRLAGIS